MEKKLESLKKITLMSFICTSHLIPLTYQSIMIFVNFRGILKEREKLRDIIDNFSQN